MDNMLEALGFPYSKTWVLNVDTDYSMELIPCDGLPMVDHNGRSFRQTFTRKGDGSSPFLVPLVREDMSYNKDVMGGFKNSGFVKSIISDSDLYSSFINYASSKLGINLIESIARGENSGLDALLAHLGLLPSKAWFLKIHSEKLLELISFDGIPQSTNDEITFRYTATHYFEDFALFLDK